MLHPKISVIMAVYNGEQYLRLALDSVFKQTFTDFEIVIVDDCSIDSTFDIVSSYNDKRIKYLKNTKNLGQTPSLNIALRTSKAEYVARLDADDIYHPEKLELQFNFMEKHPEIAVCGTSGDCIDENGIIYANRAFPIKPPDIYFRMFFHSPLNHVSVLMRKSIILKIGGYDESFPICADFALWSKLIKNNFLITNLPQSLTQFRVHVQSLSVLNKLGQSGEEMTTIIYSNIQDLLGISISRKECNDIVLMFWPASNISVIDVSNAYLNLIKIAENVYGQNITLRIWLNMHNLLLKALVKRWLYLKSINKPYSILKEMTGLIKSYYYKPALLIINIVSFFVILLLNENRIKKLKLRFTL